MELIRIDHTPGLQVMDGEFIALKPMCEALGLDHSSQSAKFKSKSWAIMAKIATVGADGKTRDMTALHKDAVPMWLATLSDNKVAPNARTTLITFNKANQLIDHLATTAKAWELFQQLEIHPAAPHHPLPPEKAAAAGYNPDQGATLTISRFLTERHPGIKFRPGTHTRVDVALLENYRTDHGNEPGYQGNNRKYVEADRHLMELTPNS